MDFETHYSQTLADLYRRTPSYQVVGHKAYHPGLETMIAWDSLCGHPHRSFRSVHVAGTNGKGSVAHMTASYLASLGYRVGLYTSPHLVDFRERLKIITNSGVEMIGKQCVLDFLDKYRSFIETSGASFFEVTTMMAFSYFASQHVDFAVIETGLGGRLDSTNIITPVLSVITSIGLDHTDILGDTIEQIASEKAGIIKPSVPVVVGCLPQRAVNVISEHARGLSSKFFQACPTEEEAAAGYSGSAGTSSEAGATGRSSAGGYDGGEMPGSSIGGYGGGEMQKASITGSMGAKTDREFLQVYVSARFGTVTSAELDLKGDYQLRNVALVDRVIDLLEEEISIPMRQNPFYPIAHAAARTGLHGRWETLRLNPTIICDIAHNPQGLSFNMRQLADTSRHFSRLVMIFGMVSDKDISSVARLLPSDAVYYFTNAQGSRALPSAELRKICISARKNSVSSYADSSIIARTNVDSRSSANSCTSVGSCSSADSCTSVGSCSSADSCTSVGSRSSVASCISIGSRSSVASRSSAVSRSSIIDLSSTGALPTSSFEIGIITNSVAEAITHYLQHSEPTDLVYIGGSSYVVAEALQILQR